MGHSLRGKNGNVMSLSTDGEDPAERYPMAAVGGRGGRGGDTNSSISGSEGGSLMVVH